MSTIRPRRPATSLFRGLCAAIGAARADLQAMQHELASERRYEREAWALHLRDQRDRPSVPTCARSQARIAASGVSL